MMDMQAGGGGEGPVYGDLPVMDNIHCAVAAVCSAFVPLPVVPSIRSHNCTFGTGGLSDEMIRRPRLRNE